MRSNRRVGAVVTGRARGTGNRGGGGRGVSTDCCF